MANKLERLNQSLQASASRARAAVKKNKSAMINFGTGAGTGVLLGAVRGKFADPTTGDLCFPKTKVSAEPFLAAGGLLLAMSGKARGATDAVLTASAVTAGVYTCRKTERWVREKFPPAAR